MHTKMSCYFCRHPRDATSRQCSPVLDPHTLFLHFLSHACWDHSVLLDFLSSPETCFLVLLIKQLHLVVNDWTGFCHACHRYSARTTAETGKELQEDLRSDRRMSCDTHEGFHRESRTSFAAEYEEGIENTNASVNINNDRVQVTTLVNYSDSEDDTDDDCDRTSDDYDCHHASHDGEGINEGVHRDSCDCDATDQLSFRRIYHLDDTEVASEIHTSCCKTEQIESTLDNGSCTAKTTVKRRTVFTIDSVTKETNKCSEIDSTNGIESYDPGTDLEHQMNSPENSADCKPDSGNTGVVTGLSSDCLDRTMAVLIRLRLKVERLQEQALFPYNATPLLRLLHMCEELYENLTHVE